MKWYVAKKCCVLWFIHCFHNESRTNFINVAYNDQRRRVVALKSTHSSKNFAQM